jgi:hypothetical protein
MEKGIFPLLGAGNKGGWEGAWVEIFHLGPPKTIHLNWEKN